MIEFQTELIEAAGVTEQEWTPRPLFGDDLYDALSAFAKARLEESIVTDKAEREAKLDTLKAEAKEHLATNFGEEFRGAQRRVRRCLEAAPEEGHARARDRPRASAWTAAAPRTSVRCRPRSAC